ncbi:MAG: ABC transporter ATP-binding protein [Chloroflexota bacterium]
MNTQTESMVQASEVIKTYRTGKIEVQALRGVSLDVKKGEMVAVMGPSGCGKTTLLNCLSGLDDFDGGEVLIEGESLRRMGDRRRTTYRAQRMGFVFQTYNLLPVLSAAENVELPLLVSGTRAGVARRRSIEALEKVGLGDRTHHKPAELSGGQRQRVTIARALVNDPAIIWADEPTGNLDSKTSADILSMMRELNQVSKQTFIIVTHTPEIGDLCDRIIRMNDGEIVEEVVNDLTAGDELDDMADDVSIDNEMYMPKE